MLSKSELIPPSTIYMTAPNTITARNTKYINTVILALLAFNEFTMTLPCWRKLPSLNILNTLRSLITRMMIKCLLPTKNIERYKGRIANKSMIP